MRHRHGAGAAPSGCPCAQRTPSLCSLGLGGGRDRGAGPGRERGRDKIPGRGSPGLGQGTVCPCRRDLGGRAEGPGPSWGGGWRGGGCIPGASSGYSKCRKKSGHLGNLIPRMVWFARASPSVLNHRRDHTPLPAGSSPREPCDQPRDRSREPHDQPPEPCDHHTASSVLGHSEMRSALLFSLGLWSSNLQTAKLFVTKMGTSPVYAGPTGQESHSPAAGGQGYRVPQHVSWGLAQSRREGGRSAILPRPPLRAQPQLRCPLVPGRLLCCRLVSRVPWPSSTCGPTDIRARRSHIPWPCAFAGF